LQEKRTSGIVADYLERLGLDIKRGFGGTGLVATLYSRSGAETVSLRADVDALPMSDKKDVPYFHQKVPGVHWQLGIANPEKGFSHPLHSPLFDFNEQVMPLGAGIHAQCAVDYLINRRHGPLTWPVNPS
jgi:metal-dependent amidase/aminoacylase/carboxypeptidase family protein